MLLYFIYKNPEIILFSNLYIKKIINSLFFLFLFPFKLGAQDIALHAKYFLSVRPNYNLTAPSNDSTSLTDGIFTSGYFWTQKSTVGWENTGQIEISIDLGSIHPVGIVSFNTARREDADVFYPENIYVFVSSDKRHLQYVGDAAQDEDHVPGPYSVKKFALSNINILARYVYLMVIPKGSFVFSDEIEVDEGKNASTPLGNQNEIINIDNLSLTIDSLNNIHVKQGVELTNINDLLKLLKEIQSSNNVALSYSNQALTNLRLKMSKPIMSEESLNQTDKQVLSLFAQGLRKNYTSTILLRMINPWDTIHPIYFPQNIENSSYPINTELDGTQYASIVLTNIGSDSQIINFKLITSDPKIANVQLFISPFVSCYNFRQLPDPIVPITKNSIKLVSGETIVFFLKATGKKSGQIRTIFQVNGSFGQEDLPVVINVYPFSITENTLNAVDWGYLSFPLINDRKEEAINDQSLHHINTVVIPPDAIPKLGNSNYSAFKSYLSLQKNVKNILLFLNYAEIVNRSPNSVGQFLSDTWKESFQNWYKNLILSANAEGFSENQIYLYPYDEVKGDNINDLKNFILWVKTKVRGVKIFGTLDNTDAIQQLVPIFDVSQIYDNSVLLNALPAHSGSIWIYDVKGDARLLSPYTYYRLMAWKAFVDGFKGIGFWNYADIGKLTDINDSLRNFQEGPDYYAVIYKGNASSIISSRRWEAFRLGIEDYQLLTWYSNKDGFNEAKKMANFVLNNPSNFYLADSIRNLIFKVLTQE